MAATPSDAELVRETIARLERITADLDSYLEHRAGELAAPLIDQANTIAGERIREADLRTRRQEDLVAELRKRVDVLQRRAVRAEQELERLRAGA